MNLVPEWRWLVRKAWSVRLVVLSALLSGVEVILPLFVDSMPRNVFAVLAMLAAVGAGVARVVAQPKMERRRKPRRAGSAANYEGRATWLSSRLRPRSAWPGDDNHRLRGRVACPPVSHHIRP